MTRDGPTDDRDATDDDRRGRAGPGDGTDPASDAEAGDRRSTIDEGGRSSDSAPETDGDGSGTVAGESPASDGSNPTDGGGPTDDEKTLNRRTVLQSMGATAAAVGAPVEGTYGDFLAGDAVTSGRNDSGRLLPLTYRQNRFDPIPESVEIAGPDTTYEVPVHREVVTGNCRDLTQFAKTGGVVPSQLDDYFDEYAPGGWTHGYWTLNGERVWPSGGSEVSVRGLPDELEIVSNPGMGPQIDLERALGRDPTDIVDIEETEDGDLKITGHDLSFGVDPEITVIDWHPFAPPSEECLEYWCRFIGMIFRHEAMHAEDKLEVAAEVNRKLQALEAPSEFDELDEDAVPDLPLKASTDMGEKAAKAVLLADFERLVRYYVDEATERNEQRAGAFHDTPEGKADLAVEDCTRYCTECRTESGQRQPLGKVTDWLLKTDYTWSAANTVSTGEEGSSTTTYINEAQRFTAEYELSRRNSGSPLVLILRLLNAIVSFFNGIESFLDGLLNVFGIDLDLIPDESGTPSFVNYRGTGEMRATYYRESYSVAEEDGRRMQFYRHARGTGEKTIDDDDASLLLRPGDWKYETSWPTRSPNFTVKTNTWTKGVNVFTTNEYRPTVSVQTGDLARRQAAGPVEPEGTPPGGERGPPGPQAEVPLGNGQAGDGVGQGDEDGVVYSMPDCGWVMGKEIRQELLADNLNPEQGATGRGVLDPEGDGKNVGEEKLSWIFVPVEPPKGDGVGHLYCPS